VKTNLWVAAQAQAALAPHADSVHNRIFTFSILPQIFLDVHWHMKPNMLTRKTHNGLLK